MIKNQKTVKELLGFWPEFSACSSQLSSPCLTIYFRISDLFFAVPCNWFIMASSASFRIKRNLGSGSAIQSRFPGTLGSLVSFPRVTILAPTEKNIHITQPRRHNNNLSFPTSFTDKITYSTFNPTQLPPFVSPLHSANILARRHTLDEWHL